MNNIFFQYYNLGIFLICVLLMFVASYLTEPPAYEKITGLTYGTLTAEEDRRSSRMSWNWRDVAASALVLGLILAAFVYVSG